MDPRGDPDFFEGDVDLSWGEKDFFESDVDPWNSGRVNDVLVLEGGGLLAAADSGGVWTVPANGNPALCLSDNWAHSNFRCLANGIAPHQVYAGGEAAALYVTDVSKVVPLLDWVLIPNLPTGTGTINRVLVLPVAGTIVLACEGGILWSPIPPSPGTAYTWQKADVEAVTRGGFYDVAAGVQHKIPAGPGQPKARITQDVIAGGKGDSSIGSPGSSAGLFVGTWDNDDVLRLRHAALTIDGNRADESTQTFGAVSVASCEGQRERAYACCALRGGDNLLFGILRSDDGGSNWTNCGTVVDITTDLKLTELAGHKGNRNNCIAVSHWDPDIVAFGFNNAFLSYNGGASWEPLGIDGVGRYPDPRHLHADIHDLTFTDSSPDVPRDLYVASDGGIASVTWGNGGWIIESDHKTDGARGDLEVVVLEGNSLVHYTRPSGQPPGPFVRQNVVTDRATGPGCLIVSERWTGSRRNYDLVVLEEGGILGSGLVHYWTDNSTSPPEWQRAQVISSLATGPGCIIQSNYTTGDTLNFEVVALEGTDLVHYWHGGADRNTPWQRVPTPITTHAASSACFIQSDFPLGADNGNFELVVLEEGGVLGRGLVHYWRDGSSPYPWFGPIMIDRNATSQACLFQSFGGESPHADFQLVVQESGELAHWFRDNSSPSFDWHFVGSMLRPGERASGPGCACQGSRGPARTIELVACIGGKLEHRCREAANPAMPCPDEGEITRSARTYRSVFNRQLPILEFYGASDANLGTLSASKLIPGLVAGGTQDNGVLYSTADHDGSFSSITPWFEPERGDGGPVAFLPARSASGPLPAAGRVLVECNNEKEGGEKVGAKSRRWDSDKRRLVGYPDPAKPVIQLATVSPTASPPPNPARGLVDPHLEPVTEPRYKVRGAFMCAVGAVGPDVYGLFLEDATDEGTFEPRRRWEYLGTVADAAGTTHDVTALASLDGLTTFVAAAVLDMGIVLQPGEEGRVYRMASDTGNTSELPMDPVLGGPIVKDIVIVSTNEAYAITSADGIIRWDGVRWRPASPVPIAVELVAITADLSRDPPVLFVAGNRLVFVSTDRGGTWRGASAGLPTAVQCSDIDWVADAGGSRVYLSTYGRSTWVATQTEQ